jgi:NAD(P)-dependent dehydrogenase (short-subunit alcohol dehydrogenase family)
MATVLITGANRGIGLELARIFTGRGDKVIAACRRGSAELEALGAEVLDGVEVADDGCMARLREGVGDRTIDVLVNNAGILQIDTLDQLDVATMRRQYEVNALGPVRVTAALRGSLRPGAKVAIITSRMGSIADNGSGKMYGYRMSKAAVNMAGVSLAHDLKDAGVAVGLFHPGMVATEMTGGNGVPPAEAAASLVKRIDELSMETSGKLLHASGQPLPW